MPVLELLCNFKVFDGATMFSAFHVFLGFRRRPRYVDPLKGKRKHNKVHGKIDFPE
jgi:hypothetical protein